MQEILTVAEFAARLKIGRSSLFEWLRKGVLVQGKHYFKVGRVLRFVWSDELIASLLARTASGGTVPPEMPPARQGRGGASGKLRTQINWDY